MVLSIAGKVYADTAAGQVQLEEKWMTASVVSCPVDADPTGIRQYIFEIAANLPLGDYGGDAGLASIHLLLWHAASVTDPMTDLASENMVRVHFDGTDQWTIEDGAALADHSADVFADILSLLTYQGYIDIQYAANALAGLWHFQAVAEQNSGAMIYSTIADFTMSSFLSISLISSTFDFGVIAIGSNKMPIQLVDGVAQGYLELMVSCNYEVTVEVGITHFYKVGSDWPIYAGYFYQNSVDDYASAITCVDWESGAISHAPLANQGSVLGDSVLVKIYLWVNAPDGQNLENGLYTGVFGVLAI